MNKFDYNGQDLKILFKGEDMYTTRLGGTISLLVYLIVILNGSLKLRQLVTYDNPTLTTSSKFVPFTENKVGVNLGKNGFDMIALVWFINPLNNKYEALNVPKSVGSFRMTQITMDY